MLGILRSKNFPLLRKFRALNLRGPTPTAKLSENKTREKIKGSTVLLSISILLAVIAVANSMWENQGGVRGNAFQDINSI